MTQFSLHGVTHPQRYDSESSLLWKHHIIYIISSLSIYVSNSTVTFNTVQHMTVGDVKFWIHDFWYRIFDEERVKIWIFSPIMELFTTLLNDLLLVFVKRMLDQIHATDPFLISLHPLT